MYAFTLTKTGTEVRLRRTLKPACVSLRVKALCAYEFACSWSCFWFCVWLLKVLAWLHTYICRVLCRDLCLWDIRRFFSVISHTGFLQSFCLLLSFPLFPPYSHFLFLFFSFWFSIVLSKSAFAFRWANSILRIHGNSNDMVNWSCCFSEKLIVSLCSHTQSKSSMFETVMNVDSCELLINPSTES